MQIVHPLVGDFGIDGLAAQHLAQRYAARADQEAARKAHLEMLHNAKQEGQNIIWGA